MVRLFLKNYLECNKVLFIADLILKWLVMTKQMSQVLCIKVRMIMIRVLKQFSSRNEIRN